jgi:DNA-binding transcriptional LysR family regulator
MGRTRREGAGMDLKQIHYFTSLYEEGSVTRAARRLNIVQPALSMQISKLEGEIGQKLFERSSQGMLPTAAGQLAYSLFVPILRDISEARQQISEGSGKVTGRIRVGMIASVTNSVLASSLVAFAQRHPEVQVSVAEGYTTTLSDWVQAGLLDFAIVNRSRLRHDLPVIPIMDEEMVVVANAAVELSVPIPVVFRDLPKLKLVIPSKRHGLRGIIDQVAESEDLDLAPRLEVDTLATIEEMVTQSDWCTILPGIALHQGLAAGRLRAHPIVAPRINRRIICVRNPRRPLTPAGQLFIDVISSDLNAAAEALRLSGEE